MVKMVGMLGAALAFTWLAAVPAQAQSTQTTPQDTTGGVEDSSQVPGQDAMTQEPQSQSGSDAIELSAVQGEQARQLQTKLKEAGFYNGRVDGILGPQTKKALQKFQEQQGFQGNGSLDQQTAEALGLNFDEIQRVRGTEQGVEQQPQSGTEYESQDPQQQSGQESQSGDAMEPAATPTGEPQPEEPIDTQSGDFDQETGTQDQEQLDPQSGTLEDEHQVDTETQSGAEAEAGEKATGTGSMNTGIDEENVQAGEQAETDVEMQAGANVSAEQIKKVQTALKEKGFFTGTETGKMDEETKNAIRKYQRAQGIPETGNLDEVTAKGLGIQLDMQHHMKTPQSGTEQEDTSIDSQSGGELDEPSGMEGDTQQDPQDVKPETEPQSGIDVELNEEDATSPVTGGATSTDETESTSGQTGMGTESMGGVESQENDPGVVDSTEIDPQAGTQTTFDKKTIKKVEKALKERQVFTGKPDGILDQETNDAIRQFQQQNGLTVTGQLDMQTLQALGVNVKDNQKIRPQSGQEPQDQPQQEPIQETPEDGGSTLPR